MRELKQVSKLFCYYTIQWPLLYKLPLLELEKKFKPEFEKKFKFTLLNNIVKKSILANFNGKIPYLVHGFRCKNGIL